MATRQTRLITRNTSTSGQTFPGDIIKGEALVNLSEGILFYSGAPSSPNFTPSNYNNGYFEVGSNLYDLRLRNKITQYEGLSGTSLNGQFLSGTSTGFVLAPISSIQGVDRHVTGFTYDEFTNTFEITQTQGGPTKTASFGAVSGLTVNGNLTVTGNTVLSSITGGSTTINGNLTVTGSTNLSGTTLYDETVSGTNPLEIINLNYLTGYVQTTDVYVTGATYTPATNDTDYTNWSLLYHGTPLVGGFSFSGENTFVTGGTYAAGTITFKYNDSGKSDFTVTGIDGTDTYVTGGTNTAATTSSPNATINLLYNQDVAPGTYTLPYTNVFTTGFTYSNNTFTIKDNSGNTYSDTINTVTGLTINGDLTVTGTSTIGTIISSALSTGRVVYTTTGGQLTTEAGFEYDQNTDTLTVDNVNATGDVVIDGNLTVYGASISAFTSNLYVEDNNIFLNYNPTGTTTGSSLGAGWTIQDGSGISNTATTLNIGKSYGNSNFTNTEYLSAVGNENRNLFTQVGDILIRNTNYNENNPDGKRVLAEGDILDGGTY